jgi:membrane-associated phospholipid phosphatase
VPSRVLTPALLAVAAAFGLLLTWFATYRVEVTSWADRGVQSGFIGLDDTRAADLAERVAHLVDPRPFALMAAALVTVALFRRRPRLALAAGVILGGANITTQVIKRVTVDSRAYDVASWQGGMGQELWPSGHTTAVMTLVLCLVLVSPHRLRPLAAALGALFVVAVVYSILLLAWHLPSDVIGGFLVATGWTLAAVAVLQAAEEHWPTRARRERPLELVAVLRPAALVAVASAATVVAVAISRPDGAMAHAIAHSAFVLGAPLIGAAALALSTGVAVAMRR